MQLYIEYRKFVETGEFDTIYPEILKIIKLMVYVHRRLVPCQEQEDVIQEIFIKIFKQLKKGKFILNDLSPIFKQIKSGEGLSEQLSMILSNYVTLANGQYHYSNFIAGKEQCFIDEFTLYFADVTFTRYIKKICESCIIDYYRKQCHEKEFIVCSLDKINENTYSGATFLDTIAEREEECNTIDDLPLPLSERNFLNHFIGDDRVLSQQEVAKKLGRSQQAVSLHFRRILKRLHK